MNRVEAAAQRYIPDTTGEFQPLEKFDRTVPALTTPTIAVFVAAFDVAYAVVYAVGPNAVDAKVRMEGAELSDLSGNALLKARRELMAA